MIKFITEKYLRDVYREEPFEVYTLKQGQRLTPGAAEYLSDKRIKITREDTESSIVNKKVSQNEETQIIQETPKEVVKEEVVKEIVKEVKSSSFNLNKRLSYKLKSIEAVFLITSNEILKEDIIISQHIISLKRKISNVRNVIDGNGILEPIYCKECTGMDSLNFRDDLDDCFEITEFHMQLEKSNAILKMNALRCSLRELEFEIIDTYQSDDENLKNRIMGNINSIINSLSQLICLAVGGKECQKRM